MRSESINFKHWIARRIAEVDFLTFLCSYFRGSSKATKQKQTNLSAISSRPFKSQLLLVIKILNAKFHEELHDLDLLTYLALSERTKEAGANNKKETS